MIDDERKLHDIAKQDYPDLPYFMFAHSWGSMIGRAYAADPFNNMNANIQFMYDFIQNFQYIDCEEWLKKVPSKVPVYMIAGDQDPIRIANRLIQSGNRVFVRCYSGYRHEILNERPIRDEVERGIIEFMERVLETMMPQR